MYRAPRFLAETSPTSTTAPTATSRGGPWRCARAQRRTRRRMFSKSTGGAIGPIGRLSTSESSPATATSSNPKRSRSVTGSVATQNRWVTMGNGTVAEIATCREQPSVSFSCYPPVIAVNPGIQVCHPREFRSPTVPCLRNVLCTRAHKLKHRRNNQVDTSTSVQEWLVRKFHVTRSGS